MPHGKLKRVVVTVRMEPSRERLSPALSLELADKQIYDPQLWTLTATRLVGQEHTTGRPVSRREVVIPTDAGVLPGRRHAGVVTLGPVSASA